MPDLGKIIEGLEFTLVESGWNADRAFDEQLMIEAVTGAIDLLKAQEPRVMALEEVTAVMKVPVWKETKNSKTLYHGWVLTYDIQKGQGITGTRLGIAEPSGRVVWYKIEDYGMTWRLWTTEPTDEQKEATPWTT